MNDEITNMIFYSFIFAVYLHFFLNYVTIKIIGK